MSNRRANYFGLWERLAEQRRFNVHLHYDMDPRDIAYACNAMEDFVVLEARVRELEARNAELEAKLASRDRLVSDVMLARAEAAEARVKVLSEALREIDALNHKWMGVLDTHLPETCAYCIARVALASTETGGREGET